MWQKTSLTWCNVSAKLKPDLESATEQEFPSSRSRNFWQKLKLGVFFISQSGARVPINADFFFANSHPMGVDRLDLPGFIVLPPSSRLAQIESKVVPHLSLLMC